MAEASLTRFRWVIKVRLIAALSMLLAFMLLRVTGLIIFPLLPFSLVVLTEAFLNQPYPWIVRKFNNEDILFFINQALDVVLITVGLHYVGGMNNFALILVYALVLIFAGTVLSSRRAYVLANISFLCYAGLVMLEFNGIWPVVALHSVSMPFETRMMMVLLTLPLFNLIAFMTGYLSSQLRQTQAWSRRLEASNQQLEHFASIASHDLQEPLARIVSLAELFNLSSQDKLNDEEKGYLEKIRDSAFHMTVLVRTILNYSRISTEPIKREKINLNDILSHVLGDLEASIARSKAKIHAGKMPVIEGDRIQLQQLFQNLISNAIKYARENTPPEVRIESRRSGKGVQVLIHDNGRGFNKDEKQRIFLPFQRLPAARKIAGTGMGLATCLRIVERHNGSLDVDSSPGRGSRFTIYLPGNF